MTGIEELDLQGREVKKSIQLCNGGIIQGCEDLRGVVFPGDGNNEPNILFHKEDFDQHCGICVQRKYCEEGTRQDILKIFEKDKKTFKKFLTPQK